MGINDKSEVVADLQIGSTSEGNVRLYISGKDFSIPLDFNPNEADDIAADTKRKLLAATKENECSVLTYGDSSFRLLSEFKSLNNIGMT